MHKLFFVIFLLVVSSTSYAHNFGHKKAVCADTIVSKYEVEKVSKKKENFFYKILKSFDNYDTRYISPNYYNFTALLQNTNTFDKIILSATNKEGKTQSLTFAPEPSFKIGPYFGWRWLFLGYTFDATSMNKSKPSNEFKFRLYSSQIGGDFIYKNIFGSSHLEKIKGFDPIDIEDVRKTELTALKSKLLSLNVYYIFNHKHFSYPAAYNQSTVQRISCGSWKLGFQYAHQNIKFNPDALPTELKSYNNKKLLFDEMKFNEINYYDYSISFGYAYNWVFAHNWLLAGSLSPSVGLKRTKGDNLSTKEILKFQNCNFDLVSRVGLVWNNAEYFAGASFINHTYDYRKTSFSITNSYSYLNIYIGLFFNRKRQYKNLKILK